MTASDQEPTKDQIAIGLMAMFRTRNADAARGCLVVVERIARGELSKLTWHRLGALLEEARLGASDEDVWTALVESGWCREHGGALVPIEKLPLAKLYEEISPRDDVEITAHDLVEFVADTPETQQLIAGTPIELSAAIARVQDWGLQLMRIAERDAMRGLPVFWERTETESVPFGTDVGSMAAADTPLLWLEPSRYGWPSGLDHQGDSAAVVRAWQQLLHNGHDKPGDWYDGAVFFPDFDDDFVGSFTREHATRGSCPTLDATAERLYTLIMLSQRVVAPELASVTLDAIESAAKCLVRWQDGEGGWAIHQYPPGSDQSMPVRDVSSRYAAEALLLGLATGAFRHDVVADASEALRRFANRLIATAARDGDRASWPGDFVTGDLSTTRRATCLFALVLGALGNRLGDARLNELQRDAINFLTDGWIPDPEAVFGVEFRCPTWEGPALATFTWEMPADSLMITACLDVEARGDRISDRVPLNEAAAGVLKHEQNGSWLDIPMAREGMFKAFASNSLHNLRALLAVAAWHGRALPLGSSGGLL